MGEHPSYLWWNGEQLRWEDATVHVTELGWSTVGAVFEGIRAYWDDQSRRALRSSGCRSTWIGW